LRKDVNWKDPMIAELLQDPHVKFPHPSSVKQHECHVDEDSFWVTNRQAFQKILMLDKTQTDVDGEWACFRG
jgi:hypothetical protein